MHWLAGYGSKPHWSKQDSLILGKPVNPNAPFSGEPTFDDSVYYIETCSREFVSAEERERPSGPIMQRRTVLKTIATSLLAPMVKLRPGIDREALMLPFCTADPAVRYDMAYPFMDDSFTYATDARRIIRSELVRPHIVGEGRLPPASEIFRDFWHPTKFIEIARPTIADLVADPRSCRPCPKCFDRMVFLGESYPDMATLADLERRGVRYDVDENSVGDESCPVCRGKFYDGPSLLEVGEERFQFALLAPAFDLPGVRFAVNREPGCPLLFTADGFEGMVMPIHRWDI